MTWLGSPVHGRWLEQETDGLLRFAAASRHPDGGFAWLDDDGAPVLDRPVELWISCRMTHVFSLGHLIGRPGCGALADHGIAALEGRFLDEEHGGWFAKVGPEGPTTTDKTAYEHAFVVLAAASATAAGRPGGAALLDKALETLVGRFWDDDAGMVVEQWDRDWTDPRRLPRRQREHAQRGGPAVGRGRARGHLPAGQGGADPHARRARPGGRQPVADPRALRRRTGSRCWSTTSTSRRTRSGPTAPRSVTGWSGHAWRCTCARPSGDRAPDWLLSDAVALFEASVREGWSVDGAPGFVYTVDWDGHPVVRERMHWVAAEATATAAALHEVTRDPAYAAWYETFWEHVATHFRDDERGSWRHELSPTLAPSGLTWAGKPDVYHAVQATLLPRLPLSPTLATALARGLLR